MSTHTFKVTQYTRDDGLRLQGSSLGWAITMTGYGPNWFYKDRWVISTTKGLTVQSTHYDSFEEAMTAFTSVKWSWPVV